MKLKFLVILILLSTASMFVNAKHRHYRSRWGGRGGFGIGLNFGGPYYGGYYSPYWGSPYYGSYYSSPGFGIWF